jgi:hypothetical protein
MRRASHGIVGAVNVLRSGDGLYLSVEPIRSVTLSHQQLNVWGRLLSTNGHRGGPRRFPKPTKPAGSLPHRSAALQKAGRGPFGRPTADNVKAANRLGGTFDRRLRATPEIGRGGGNLVVDGSSEWL